MHMIAIIGGGISGLSLAYYLKMFGVNDFVLFEKETSVGGKIQTKEYPSYFLELGPNTLLTTTLVDELIKELDLNKKQIFPDVNVTKNRYIANNGQITLLPSKPQSLFFR
jgi:protoporphyrinogen/coproporphyrinogen III oxidase